MERCTSPLGYLGIAATLLTAATTFLIVIGRVQYWTPTLRTIALATLSGAVLLFVTTDDWKERCIATAAISAALALLAVQLALYLSVIHGGSI
jgi:hypothetical protein